MYYNDEDFLKPLHHITMDPLEVVRFKMITPTFFKNKTPHPCELQKVQVQVFKKQKKIIHPSDTATNCKNGLNFVTAVRHSQKHIQKTKQMIHPSDTATKCQK